MSEMIMAPISAGELLDKLTILIIKAQRLTDESKRVHVLKEKQVLEALCAAQAWGFAEVQALVQRLQAVNEELWQIEDDIRDCERQADFGARFIALARAVYHVNDRRAQIKRDINVLLGSVLMEEKSYAAY